MTTPGAPVKTFGSGKGSQVHTPSSPAIQPPVDQPEVVEGAPATVEALVLPPAQAAPKINPLALGDTLRNLNKKTATKPRKLFPINLQLDAETYKVLSDEAGYRGMPELLRKVFVEIANSPQVTATHLKNAGQTVAELRLPIAKGGKGLGPKLTISVDGTIKNAADVLAKRAGIAPKGVMEAVAYIYSTISQGKK